MAGRQASQSLVRYPGIQVQTSSLGLNIPVGWGTFRCKCNLVDYLDFISKPIKASSGKGGGGTTTSYDYDATIIMALCEGPIDSVSQVYANGKVFFNGAHTALFQASLTLSTGAIGQPVWSYLTSNHPDHAIGYSGLAIVYCAHYELDSAATPPNFSFEVVRTSAFGVSGTEDADPSLVITDFFTNPRYGVPSWRAGLIGDLTQYQNYCLAAGLLVSPVIDAQRSASEFITELLRATNSTCVWSEGVLKFIPYGDHALTGNGKTYAPNNTPVYSLSDDDYIPHSDGADPLTIDIQDQSDAWNVVQLEYLDRTNQYNMAIALSSDAANVAQYGMRRKAPDTVHCVATPSIAALSSQLFLQRALYIRSQFKFTLGWQFALLEPGDILELTDSALALSAYPVRIIQIEDDEDACRTITAEDFPIGVSHSPLYTLQSGGAPAQNTNVDPGGVEANLLIYSGDATQVSVWGQNACTVTGAAGTDQYGLTTACTIVPTAVSNWHGVYQSISTFAGLNYTYSACLKQGAHKYGRLEVSDFIASDAWATFDLNAGTVFASGTDGTDAHLVSASIAPSLVAGIWLCTITVSFAAATTLHPLAAACDASGNFGWVGDGSNAIQVSQQQFRQGVAAGIYAETAGAPAGPVIFNPPAALNSGGSSMFAAVAGGPNWGGCFVWASVDNTTFDEIGRIDGSARFGRLTAALPSHGDPDTADTLSVDLGWSGGALAGAVNAAVDNGATTSWINGELVGFAGATLTNPSRYNLGVYLRRGFQNTPIAAHSAGDLFVRMDQQIFDFPYLDINSGVPIYLKFQSFNIFGNALVPLADCLAYAATPNAVAANAPGPAAWTAAAATLTAGGVAVPVLEITGAVDNPSATSILTFYRPHGAGAWVSGGAFSDASTIMYLPTVVSGQAYDVGIAYIVSGVQTGITQIGTNITVGRAVPPSASPNLVYNPTFALGLDGWNSVGASAASYTSGGGEGYYAYASATGTGATASYYQDFAVYPNTAYSMAAGLIDVFATAGNTVRFYGEWIDASRTHHLGYTAVVLPTPGIAFARYQAPAQLSPQHVNVGGTFYDAAYLRVWIDTYARIAPGGDVGGWQQIKVELGPTCTNYTDDATSGATYPGGTAISQLQPAQAGATKNVTHYQGVDPGGTDGDIWVDTAVTPNITYLRSGGAWVAAANHVTATSQVTDDALLGQTAAWTGVSSRPANVAALSGSEAINNATLQSQLTSGTVQPLYIQSQGALATLNAADTPQIVANAVTDTSAWSATNAVAGTGGYVDIFNESVTVANAGQLLIWAQLQVNDGGGHSASSHTSGLRILVGGSVIQTTQYNSSPNAIGLFTCICTVAVSAGTINVDAQALCQSFDNYTYRTLIVEVVYR